MGEYGIVANVAESDRVFRMGAKAWLVSAESGGERVICRAASRSGRQIEKHAPTSRFNNFRAAWIPEHLRPLDISGTKEEMQERAAFWNERADLARADHPNRGFKPESASPNA